MRTALVVLEALEGTYQLSFDLGADCETPELERELAKARVRLLVPLCRYGCGHCEGGGADIVSINILESTGS